MISFLAFCVNRLAHRWVDQLLGMKYRTLLGCLDWDHFPERPTHRSDSSG